MNNMNIWTYIKEKKQERKEAKAFAKRLKASGLHFPILCKLHGVTSPTHQGAIAQSRASDELQIVHTPTPEFPDRVSVYSISLNRTLGFLEDTLSKKLIFAFGAGFCRDGEVKAVTGGAPHPYFGCNIRILDTKEFLQDCEDFSHLYE